MLFESSSNSVSSPPRTALESAWNDVQRHLKTYTTLMREREGWKHAVVTICVMNGESLETYTLPEKDWEAGIAGFIAEGGMKEERNGSPGSTPGRDLEVPRVAGGAASCEETGTNETAAGDEHSPLTKFEAMIMLQLNRFLTQVRETLGLRSFSWPAQAKAKYKQLLLYRFRKLLVVASTI